MYEMFDDELKYKYGGNRQKMQESVEREIEAIEEKNREKIYKPIKDKLTDIENLNARILQKVEVLEKENVELAKQNNELKDIRRWRDGRKEFPPQVQDTNFSLKVQVMTPGVKTIQVGFYDYKIQGWLVTYGFDVCPALVIYWRPLDLPEKFE